MIKTFINRLLGRKTATSSNPTGAAGAAARPSQPTRKPARKTRTGKARAASQPHIVSVSEHKIDPALISRNAVKVTGTLQQAGYQAFIVGGAVRDLLLGIAPKDFDVATDATPEQVQTLFRRARLIGRRFQIVHVVFYGGRDQEVIEVSTFRALVDAQASTQVGQRHGKKRGDLDRHQHATDASGRVLRDNVWGTQAEDATRRDFTINAMYYDPATQTVHDYHGGMDDMRARTLRMIGDPVTRYREDPVRMLRVVRFAAKTGFSIDAQTRAPIAELAELIHDVPEARLFDELLKLLLSGHAWASMQELRRAGLHHGLLSLVDVVLEQPLGERFVQLALANTDERVQAGKPVSPGFLFAALLWHQVLDVWNTRKGAGELPIPALFAAMDQVLATQTGKLAIQKRHVADMKDIWALQPRFERRTGRNPHRLLETPRFRAGYDFLILRCESGEVPAELGDWWTHFQEAEGAQREAMIEALRLAQPADEVAGPARKRGRRRRGGPRGPSASGHD